MKIKNNSSIIDDILNLIQKSSSREYLRFLTHSLQLQKGGYGAENLCVGTKLPLLRKISKNYYDIENTDLETLLLHEIHEMRIVALLIMMRKFISSPKNIYELYVRNIHVIDNWDLVDLSAHKILGEYAYLKNDFSDIEKFSASDMLWENRISIVSLLAFIKREEFDFPLKIIKKLLTHSHHLILKAVGWMLREIGKLDQDMMLNFINENHSQISTITKRYAMEILKKDPST